MADVIERVAVLEKALREQLEARRCSDYEDGAMGYPGKVHEHDDLYCTLCCLLKRGWRALDAEETTFDLIAQDAEVRGAIEGVIATLHGNSYGLTVEDVLEAMRMAARALEDAMGPRELDDEHRLASYDCCHECTLKRIRQEEEGLGSGG